MPKAKILEIRDRFSKAWSMKGKDSPWGTSEDEMVIKTVIKRHIKRMNLSIEIATAARADDQADTDMKQENFLEVEFKQIAEQAEEADFNLQGSREKQEDMAQQKIAELKGEPKETAEEEMDRITREEAAKEMAQSRTPKPALKFGNRGDK
jgi:recombinational DNA repair protein RecT